MRENRSEAVANDGLASGAVQRIATRLHVESTRRDWRAVLADRDERRTNRREQRRAHPRNQSGRAALGMLASVASMAATAATLAAGALGYLLGAIFAR
jgi:hypothetical protein